MATVGVARFNFTVTSPDHTLASLKMVIEEKIREIPGISIAMNTFALQIDEAKPPQDPPMPNFDKVQGSIRSRS